VAFFQGCSFDCLACHNPHTIPLTSVHARQVTVEGLVDEVRPHAPFLSGITVSGGEATLQADFVRAFFAAIKGDPGLGRLTTFVDTNGGCAPEVWDALTPVMDGAMVDLKALDPDLHQRVAGASNAPVLASIRHLAAAGRLYEVRLLLVPGVNDSPDQLAATAEWLLGVDPALRVKVIGFRPHGVRAAAREWPEPTEGQRTAYRAALTAAGVRELVVV
jgi:pyruvate formate lyase activating enzyme